MAIPEPSDNVGFWDTVKSFTVDQLWPPDDEQDAWDLAAEWKSVAKLMNDTATALDTQANRAELVWTDTAGAQFAYLLRNLPENFRLVAENMTHLADGMDDYGNSLREARINIVVELVVNIGLFAALAWAPGGGFLASGLARVVAGRLTSMITSLAGRALSGGLTRALELGAKLGVEMGKEAFDEAFINTATQLTSMAMGTRDQFDLGQVGKSAAAGAVGGVLGEGLGKITEPLTRATQSGLGRVMPDSVARNVTAGVTSFGNNALTSPTAGYIVENYNNLSALTDINGYAESIRQNGIASGLMGMPRSMVVDAVQQMHPGGESLVDDWVDRQLGNNPAPMDPGGGQDVTPPGPSTSDGGQGDPGAGGDPGGGQTGDSGAGQGGDSGAGQGGNSGAGQGGDSSAGTGQAGDAGAGQTGDSGAGQAGNSGQGSNSGAGQADGAGAGAGQVDGAGAGQADGAGAGAGQTGSGQAGNPSAGQAGDAGTGGNQTGDGNQAGGANQTGDANQGANTGGTQTGGSGANASHSGGAQSGGTQSSGTQSSGTQSSGTQSGATQSGGTQSGGTQSSTSGAQSADPSHANGTQPDTNGTQSADPSHSNGTESGNTGTQATDSNGTRSDTSSAQPADPSHTNGTQPGDTQSADAGHPDSGQPGHSDGTTQPVSGTSASVAVGPAPVVGGTQPVVGSATSAPVSTAPAHTTSGPAQAAPTQASQAPTHTTSTGQSTNTRGDNTPTSEESTPAPSTEESAPQLVVTASGAVVVAQAAAVSTPQDTNPAPVGPTPTHTRVAPTSHPPDVTPSQPLSRRPHSLGTFSEDRLTRDANGRITEIDQTPVAEKLRQLAEARVEHYWNSQRYEDLTRYEEGSNRTRPEAPFTTDPRQRPDISLNQEVVTDDEGNDQLQDRNWTENVMALAIDTRTGEIFEALNGPPAETIHDKLEQRLEAVRKPGGYPKFDRQGRPKPDETHDMPYEAEPFHHAEIRAVNLGLQSNPEAEPSDFITDVQFLRGGGVKPAWYCPNCAALLHDVPTNAGKRVYTDNIHEDEPDRTPTPGYKDEPGHFGDDPKAPPRPPTEPPRLRGTPPNNPDPNASQPPTGANPTPTTSQPTTPTNPTQTTTGQPTTPANPTQTSGNPTTSTTPTQANTSQPTTSQPTTNPTQTSTSQPTTSTNPTQTSSSNPTTPTQAGNTSPSPTTSPQSTPGPQSRVDSVKAVPHSRFGVKPNAGYNHAQVKTRAHAAMPTVAPDAGVQSITSLGWNRFEVTRIDGSTFVVTVLAADLNAGNLAEIRVTGANQVHIDISARADLKIVERTVASAVARADALLLGTQNDTNLLDGNSHPGAKTELSATDHGRQAEVRQLDRNKQETSRLRMLRRRRIAQEMRALVEHLGVHPDDEVSPQRRAVADIGDTVDRHVTAGERRPAWAKAPDGYPKWRAFLLYHLPAEIAPGVAAGATIALTGAPIVGAGVAVASIATGVSGTFVKRWYGRQDKTNTDTGHGIAIKQREYEKALRRKQLLDPLLARVNGQDPGPVEPKPDSTMPPTHQSYPAQLIGRGLPATIGAGVASLLMFAGLPFWNAAAHWGVAAIAATTGPLVERYLRKSLVRREWALLDNVGREKDQTAHEFDVAFAETLSALLDRIDNIAGQVNNAPAPNVGNVQSTDVNNTGVHRYGAAQAGQFNNLSNASADAASKIEASKAPAGGNQNQVNQQGAINSAIDSLLTGTVRSALGLLINAVLDRNFTANEYKEIVAQVHFDFGGKMAEQVTLEQQIATRILDELTAQVDAAEQAVNRVNQTLASRVADLQAATPPAPTPDDPANRPRGHQRMWAFAKLHVKQGLAMEGLMVGSALAFNQGTTGIIVVGAVSAMIASSFGLRYLFRRSEQLAVDETIFADRAKERPVEAAQAKARQEFDIEFWTRRILVAAGQLTSGQPTAPTVPALDPANPAFPDHIDTLIGHERESMLHEPRPWSTVDGRLAALNRMSTLAQRIRDFAANGATRPEAQARTDLEHLWNAYQELKTDGTAMPTDYELLANEKPEGLRGGQSSQGPNAQSYIDASVATPAGRAFYAPGDELLAEADQVPVTPGQYTIDMHGGPDFVRIGSDRLTAADLAALIMADPNWRGEPIRLLACETGQNEDGFAQQLADHLGVTVYAPSDFVGLSPDGEVFVTTTEVDSAGIVRPVLPATGTMYAFEPTVTDQPAHQPHTHVGMWWPDRTEIHIGEMREPRPLEDLGPLTLLRDGPTVYTGPERLWPDELAEVVTGSGDWAHGPTRLQVRDGHVDPEFVQRLADLLGTPVLITAEAVAGEFPALSSGTLEVYNEPSPLETPPGDWRIYEPRDVTAGKGTP